MFKKRRWILLVVAYVALIFVGSSIPRLAPPGPEFFFKDKIAHFFEYFVLGFLLFNSIIWDGRPRWVLSGFLFAVAATVGALDEIYQSYMPGRDMNINDWFADIAGAGVAIGIFVSTRLPARNQTAARGSGEEEHA